MNPKSFPPNCKNARKSADSFTVSAALFNLHNHEAAVSILLVEGDEALRRSLAIALHLENYSVVPAATVPMAWQMLAQYPIQLVLLDIDRPLLDGQHFCAELRKRSNVPVIVLSANSDSEDVIAWIKLGADAHLTKPFPIQLLNARIRTLLRRVTPEPQSHVANRLTFGDIVLDEKQHEVTIRGERIDLSPSEFCLLRHLMQNPGRLIRKEEIQEVLWHYQSRAETSSVHGTIRRLQRKIESDPAHPHYLKTVFGEGYQFADRLNLGNQTHRENF